MRRRLTSLTIGCGLALMHGAMPAPVVSAGDGSVIGQLTADCTVHTATGTHSSVESRYIVTGACGFYDSGHLDRFRTITWTAAGSHQPNTKATFETLTMTHVLNGKTVETGSVTSTMQCGTDPWRQAPSAPCRFPVRTTAPASLGGYLRVAYDDSLAARAPGLPLSVMLSPVQRAGLEKQYQLSMATHQKPGALGPRRDKPGTPLSPGNAAGLGAGTNVLRDWPAIQEPNEGATVVQGQFRIRATAPQIDSGPDAELEFVWLDASALNPYFNVWSVPMKDLINGTMVPAGVTRGQTGHWQVRARVSPKGSWGPPWLFKLALTQPTQTLKMSPPNPATPFSSTEPISVEGVSKGSGRPQTTPQQGLGAGTTLIRPRGVEGGKGQEPPPDTENKP